MREVSRVARVPQIDQIPLTRREREEIAEGAWLLPGLALDVADDLLAAIAEAVEYGTGEGGVRVARAEFGDPEGRLVYQPDHPLADDEGYVKYPDIDLGDQM